MFFANLIVTNFNVKRPIWICHMNNIAKCCNYKMLIKPGIGIVYGFYEDL